MPANLIVAIGFLVWDVLFTKEQVWGFNANYLTGVLLYNLPLEEVLFFICIPYACVFTYFALKYLFTYNPLKRFERIITLVLSILFILVGFYFNDRLYTTITFLLTGIYLTTAFFMKTSMAWIYLTFFTIFPFFILSNGILTGSLLEAPIVWYNDSENIGLRVLTIPIEDSVYGFLLIALNIQLYEKIKAYKQKKAEVY